MHLLKEEYLSPVTHRCLFRVLFGGAASSLHVSRAYQERDPTQIPPTHVTKYRHVTAAAPEAHQSGMRLDRDVGRRFSATKTWRPPGTVKEPQRHGVPVKADPLEEQILVWERERY
jgi:hypothetical protein